MPENYKMNAGDIVEFIDPTYRSSQDFDFVGILIEITYFSHSEKSFFYARILNNRGKFEIWPSTNLVRYGKR